MVISEEDLEMLKKGIPPLNKDLLAAMTLGDNRWNEHLKEHYLYNYISRGDGSKVKVLVGGAGTGKTHLLNCMAEEAAELGYVDFVVVLPLSLVIMKTNMTGQETFCLTW